jgi:hypothetical protein
LEKEPAECRPLQMQAPQPQAKMKTFGVSCSHNSLSKQASLSPL